MTVIERAREHLDRLYALMNLLTDLGYDSTGETAYEDTKALETELVRLADQLAGAVASIEAIVEHARRDWNERGIAEAERYVLLAQDALDRLRGQ